MVRRRRCGFDNLTYICPASPAPALSANGLALAVIGLLAVGALMLRRRPLRS